MEPVFVFGCDRSGTTMLASMIGSFPNTICLPEAQFLSELSRELSLEKSFDTRQKQSLIERIKQHQRYQIWENKLPEESWEKIEESTNFSHFFDLFASEYANNQGTKANRWIDHTPASISYLLSLDLHFSHSKFIHIFRDPRAVVSSLIKVDWGPNDIVSATERWMCSIAKGLAASQVMDGEKLIHVRYEDIVNQDAKTLNKIALHLGEKDPSPLAKTDGFNAPKYSASTHEILSGGLTNSRTNAWMKDLTTRQIEICEYLCGDMLNSLGYEPINLNPDGPKIVEKLSLTIADMTSNIINRGRRKLREQGKK